MAEIIVNPMTDSKEQMLAILGMMAETFQNSIIPATDMGAWIHDDFMESLYKGALACKEYVELVGIDESRELLNSYFRFFDEVRKHTME